MDSFLCASTLLHWGFDSDGIGLMRLAIAEARRFPDLAATVSRTAGELSTELGVHLLNDLTRADERLRMNEKDLPRGRTMRHLVWSCSD
jgi:hypothetical protein